MASREQVIQGLLPVLTEHKNNSESFAWKQVSGQSSTAQTITQLEILFYESKVILKNLSTSPLLHDSKNYVFIKIEM